MPHSKASRSLARWCALHTQAELVRRLRERTGRPVNQSTVSRWLNGERLPGPVYVAALADEIGIKPQHWYLAPT